MKKLIIGMMAAAFALVAFCEGDDNNSPIVSDSNPNPLIVSDNAFGSIKVNTKSEFTMVAVPFEGFASQFEDGNAKPNQILARDAIAVEMLNHQDMMSIRKLDSTDPKEEFDNYFASFNTWMVGRQTYAAMSWSTSGWFTQENLNSYAAPEANMRLVNIGSGVFIGLGETSKNYLRQVATTEDDPYYHIYAYGQIPQNFNYTAENELKKGKTMLSPVGERAYSPVDLNKLNWRGDFTEVSGTERTNERFVAEYGAETILTGISTPETTDYVVYFDTEKQEQREFVRYKGRWIRIAKPGIASLANDAFIPAGQAFWYLRKANESAYMAWDKVEPDQPVISD